MKMSRRRFVAASGSCASYLAAAAPLLSTSALRRWMEVPRAPRLVAQKPFARIEEVGSGSFAVVSTPLEGDYTTVCNGGIIGGTAGTVVVEAFATPAGAAWVAGQARELTGRWPTHVVVTHYHGDHSAGPAGFRPDNGQDADGQNGQLPALRATAATRSRVLESQRDESVRAAWADAIVLPAAEPAEIDLGDRVLTVVPRSGHTASDLSVELDGGSGPVWCGDLVWNAMFPNYMDARPSTLSRSVRALQALPASVFVPGHGPLANSSAMADFAALIDSVEDAAREAFRRGANAEDAARSYRPPGALGEWTLFSPTYYQRAIQAWLDELGR